MKLEILGVKLPEQDKEILRQVAERNRLTMSDIARMLIADGIEHISERDLLKLTSR